MTIPCELYVVSCEAPTKQSPGCELRRPSNYPKPFILVVCEPVSPTSCTVMLLAGCRHQPARARFTARPVQHCTVHNAHAPDNSEHASVHSSPAQSVLTTDLPARGPADQLSAPLVERFGRLFVYKSSYKVFAQRHQKVTELHKAALRGAARRCVRPLFCELRPLPDPQTPPFAHHGSTI